MQTAQCPRMRSKTGYAELGYFHCYLKMDAPRALVFWPLVKGNEALGTRLMEKWKVQNTMYAKYNTCKREKRGSNRTKWFTAYETLLLNTGKLKYLGNTFFHYVISSASKTVVRAQKSKNGEVGLEHILFQEMVRGIELCTSQNWQMKLWKTSYGNEWTNWVTVKYVHVMWIKVQNKKKLLGILTVN